VQLKEQAFDPKTCVTAKQLREQGYAVPDRIPDEAWAFTKDLKMQIVGSKRVGNQAHVSVRLIDTAFRWAGKAASA